MVNADRTADPPLLQMRGIVKQFPGVRALDGVDLEIRAGEVHCLLGQNGAGKSTLIKVLAGAHQPDEGEILVDGEPVTIAHPGRRPASSGIATMYQELDVVDGLSVAENIYLGHELATGGFSQRRAATAPHPRRCSTRLGHGDISPAPRGRPAVRRRQADRQHGARPVARRPADRHGRAVGRAGRRGGRQPLPRGPRAHRGGRRRRLHLPPPRGDPPDRRPDHRAQGRPDRRDRACRSRRRRPPSSSGS